MNDNIIKMFIGGEEVVSNKEFTINEEMLSASSTILNNCYPASWEESKDYVSNFYYPKDYSKYILGKGNFTYGTDQYYILTISGNNFIQFTTNVEKEFAGFTVYGNTTQETRSGKNLFNKDVTFSTNGASSTILDTGIRVTSTVTGNYRRVFTKIGGSELLGKTITVSSTMTVSASNIPSIRLFFGSSSNSAIQSIGDLSSTGFSTMTIPSSFPTNATGIYVLLYSNTNGTGNIDDYVDYTNLQIELGSIATDYEPYGVMPSPDNPSELVSVGYENLLKNTATTQTINGITFTKNEDGTITANGTATANSQLLLTRENNEYGNMYLSGCHSGDGSNYFINLSYLNENNVWQREQHETGNGLLITNSYPKIAVSLYIKSGFSCNNLIFKPMISKQLHSYIPYGKYGIEVKTTGKNLFDKNLFNNFTTALQYINLQLKPNTTYIMSSSLPSWTSYPLYANLFVMNSTDSPSSTTNSVFPNAPRSITTLNDGIVKIAYRDGDNEYSDEKNTYWYQLEENTQATEYEPYKENTQLYQLDNPLRSIGDTKDLLYIKNSMLYVERKIGKVILNGSETWAISNNCYYTYISSKRSIKSPSSIGLLSNYFKNSSASAPGNVPLNQMFEFYNPNIINKNVGFNYDYCSGGVDNFKTWLSTHNTEVQYILATPVIEELGAIELPVSYNEINNVEINTGIDTTSEIDYYWKNYDVLFAGIVKNSGDISLRPTDPKYCSLQILDYKTFLSESDTLDFVISDKTIAEAISMVVDAIRGYGFILGTINISQADDIIGAYSTLNKTAYDVFQYLANISGSRWRARFVDSDTMAIDFYDPELLPRANDIDYTQQYWEDNKIVDLTFNYGTRDYRNKQIILSDEVYGGIDYTEVLLSNGYGTSYITQNNIANITSITVNGVEAEVITQSEKDLGVDADFYYTPGKNVVESTTSYTAGTQIIITYTPLVKGRQIVYNDEEVTRIATQTNTTGVISRYENRNDILSSDELENIAETYIKYKGKPEIILKLTTLNNDLFNIGEICYFNSPIADLAQDYMVKSKATNYTSVAGETNIFYTYELTSSFNSEKAINYFDNQRNKATGNIAEGESITRNIDINNSAMIIWENATITEISVSVDGDNALNSVLNSPFIQ